MGEKAEKSVVTFAGVRVSVSRDTDGGLLINVGTVRPPKVGAPLTADADGRVKLRVVVAGPDGKPVRQMPTGLVRRGQLHPSVPQPKDRIATGDAGPSVS